MPKPRLRTRSRPWLAMVLLFLAPLPVRAEPQSYRMDPSATTVGFATDFGADTITGLLPVADHDLHLDFQSPAQSTINVTLNVRGASASFPFAAEALKGPKVLDAGGFPTIAFRSQAIRADGEGALVAGDLTIRGVTRPVTLTARFWQAEGSAPGDLAHLTVQLTTAVNRSDFGADGWSDMVGDEVRIQITARIDRQE